MSDPTAATNQAAAREMQRFLQQRVRNDWDWPPPPPSLHDSTTSTAANPALNSSSPTATTRFTAGTPARPRYYGESEASSDDAGAAGEEDYTVAVGAGSATTTVVRDPCRFEDPAELGETVAREREERRRRRRRREVEEAQWNEGLRVFVERRDVWTGVVELGEARGMKRGRGEAEMEIEEGESTATNGHDHTSVSHMTTATTTTTATITTTPSLASVDADPLIPLAPPLDPHNPIRASITPASYPEIYGKVVSGSRSPSVPINLADMTRALVQGWKDAGEWPPRPAPVDPLAGGRRRGAASGAFGALGNKVSVVGGPAARLRAGEAGNAEEGLGAQGEAGRQRSSGEVLEQQHAHHHHGRLRKGIEGVRRVFRISGGHASAAGAESTSAATATEGGRG